MLTAFASSSLLVMMREGRVCDGILFASVKFLHEFSQHRTLINIVKIQRDKRGEPADLYSPAV